MAMGEVFKLRNYESEWGESPGDKLIFLRTGTMAAGELSVDLSKEVEKGATVYYIPLIKAVTDSTTGAITAENAIADDAAVNVLIVTSANNLAPTSQMFGG